MLGNTRQLIREVIASNRCICNTASSPLYEISVCHNCLTETSSIMLNYAENIFVAYVCCGLKPGLQ